MSTEPELVEVFDTTLRDGLQVEGVSATVDDKLRIAEQLDFLGVHYIEGGWPGANPKDIEFFARATRELTFSTSTLVAFGSTRRPRGKVDDDATLRNLIEANTSAVCIVAKSWDYHVLEALQTTLDEGAAMIADSVEYLKGHGRLVMVDMEHFFDGYKRNPEFSLRAIEAAVTRGASHRPTSGHASPIMNDQRFSVLWSACRSRTSAALGAVCASSRSMPGISSVMSPYAP